MQYDLGAPGIFRSDTMSNSASFKLTGVPETMLWPLWNRAAEARRNDPLIEDPISVELVRTIDYPFEANFGKTHVSHAVRARYCDDLIREFFRLYPASNIVALGEGLDSQLWRIDNGRMHWYSVDLPEAIEVRRNLLPRHERNIQIACSALDRRWINSVPSDKPVFISAAGLLMYFKAEQVFALLQAIRSHFSNAELFFDVIPPSFSRKTMNGWEVTKNYTVPPMPFGLALGQIHTLSQQVPGMKILSALTYAEPFPARMKFFAMLSKICWLRDSIAPGLIHAKMS